MNQRTFSNDGRTFFAICWQRQIRLIGLSLRSSAWLLSLIVVLLWYFSAMTLGRLTSPTYISLEEIRVSVALNQADHQAWRAAQYTQRKESIYRLVEDIDDDALTLLEASGPSYLKIRASIEASSLTAQEKENRLKQLRKLARPEMSLFEAGWRFKMNAVFQLAQGNVRVFMADMSLFFKWVLTKQMLFMTAYMIVNTLIYLFFGLAIVRIAAESICHKARLSTLVAVAYSLKNSKTMVFAFAQVGLLLFVLNILPLILFGLNRLFPGQVMDGILAIFSPIILIICAASTFVLIINKLATGLFMPGFVINRCDSFDVLSHAYKQVLTGFWRVCQAYFIFAIHHTLLLALLSIFAALVLLLLQAMSCLIGSAAIDALQIAGSLLSSGQLPGSDCLATTVWQWVIGLFLALLAGIWVTHLAYGMTSIYLSLREVSDQRCYGEVNWASWLDEKENLSPAGNPGEVEPDKGTRQVSN